jgi:hypothetical protein
MKRLLAVAILALPLLLTGCASATSPSNDSTPSTTASATPTYASENQVASVIAKYAADWRETIDGAGKCRFEWTLSPGSMAGATCWLNEQTLVTTAEIVNRDVEKLNIPPSMASLVDSTTTVLQGIVDEDAKTVCGDGVADPLDTPECTKVIGSLNFYYSMLKGELDSWGPYL